MTLCEKLSPMCEYVCKHGILKRYKLEICKVTNKTDTPIMTITGRHK